jgi:hypothetical protein
MLSILPFILVISATQPVQPVVIDTAEFTIEMTPRTPDQMRSFYEARGFPVEMLDEISRYCFITTGITNKGKDKLWLDLSQWEYSSGGKIIERRHRSQWKAHWQKTGMPKSSQATFRWTLMPETLDYLPGEREGGNVTLPFTPGHFTLEASFRTGDDKKGEIINIRTDKLFCAEDPEQ